MKHDGCAAEKNIFKLSNNPSFFQLRLNQLIKFYNGFFIDHNN